MIKALLNGIMKMVTSVLDIVLLPVNSLISNLFPDMSVAISRFTAFVNSYFGTGLTYFFQLIPPLTRNIIVLWFTFLITYYGVVWSYSLIIKIWNVIQKIKFW